MRQNKGSLEAISEMELNIFVKKEHFFILGFGILSRWFGHIWNMVHIIFGVAKPQ
jgi:hypothetical protein